MLLAVFSRVISSGSVSKVTKRSAGLSDLALRASQLINPDSGDWTDIAPPVVTQSTLLADDRSLLRVFH